MGHRAGKGRGRLSAAGLASAPSGFSPRGGMGDTPGGFADLVGKDGLGFGEIKLENCKSPRLVPGFLQGTPCLGSPPSQERCPPCPDPCPSVP